MTTGGEFFGRKYWPGFRVVKVMRDYGINFLKTNLLEPGFYWRIQHDYGSYPNPEILPVGDVHDNLDEIKKMILSRSSSNRIVLHASTCLDIRCKSATMKWAVSFVLFFMSCG